MEKLLVGRKEAAQALDISVRKLFDLVKDGVIPVRRIGKRVLISRRALQKFAK